MPPGVGYPQIPGLLAVNDPTPPILRRMAPRSERTPVPVRGMPLAERLKEALFQVVGGANDPNLTTGQNRDAAKQAMLMSGLATLAAANQPGATAGGALAQGLLFGQQAGAGERQAVRLRTQEERVQEALNDPELMGLLTPRQRQVLRFLPLEAATGVLAEVLMAGPPEPKVLAEGAALVGADGKPIFTNARQTDPLEGLPSNFRAFVSASGIDYGNAPAEQRLALLQDWLQSEQTRAGAGADRTIINTGAQTAEGVTGIAIKDYEKLAEAASGAQAKLGELAVMGSLLDEGLETGAVADLSMPLRNVAASFGVGNVDQLSDQQVFNAISNKLAREARVPGEGQMSDADMRFQLATVPNLKNTPEGNRTLVEILSRKAQREIELMNLANQYIAEHGTLDHRWFQFKQEWIQNNPLFADMAAPF